MVTVERKKLQYQLQALRARKAKADSLGQEVIERTRATYDGICSEIARLEKEFREAPGTDPMMDHLQKVIHETLTWKWPGAGIYEQCEKTYPGLKAEIDSASRELTRAYHAGDEKTFYAETETYRAAMLRMNEICNDPIKQLGWKEIEDDDCPWGKK